MVKYCCNAFHALKVTFANEIGTICNELGVDPHAVMNIFKSDERLNISRAYLTPGFAFGGSCLPKDLRALTYRAKELDLNLPLLQSIIPSNDEQVERAVQTVLAAGKRRIGILGLSFKAGTDDLRESQLVRLAKRLLGEGCEIRIWDPHVALGQLVGSNRQFIHEVIPHIGALIADKLEDVIAHAEVVVIGTKLVDKKRLLAQLKHDQLLLDISDATPLDGARLRLQAAVNAD
jgi:GDP-mannose 6-dehydrogenase